MFRKFLVIISVLTVFLSSPAFAKTDKITTVWNSPKGLEMLNESQFKNDFYQLINFFQPQINPLYCSAATGTIILNALYYGDIPSQKSGEVVRPKDLGGQIIQFHSYSQAGFFNNETDFIKQREIIDFKSKVSGKDSYDPGLTLAEFSKILSKVYGLKTEIIYAKKNDEKSLNKFRKNLKRVLSDDKNFIAANFNGKLIGNKTGGHISPIAAYDEKTDSILILDVALHKNLWYFVPVKDFYAAMNSKDGDNFRGYLIVRR